MPAAGRKQPLSRRCGTVPAPRAASPRHSPAPPGGQEPGYAARGTAPRPNPNAASPTHRLLPIAAGTHRARCPRSQRILPRFARRSAPSRSARWRPPPHRAPHCPRAGLAAPSRPRAAAKGGRSLRRPGKGTGLPSGPLGRHVGVRYLWTGAALGSGGAASRESRPPGPAASLPALQRRRLGLRGALPARGGRAPGAPAAAPQP